MKIALVGNPNSGKTSLFNTLTGLHQKVGNFPGVTVERKSGKLTLADQQSVTLIDLPGIYNLYPTSEDEQIACEVIRNPKHSDHADMWIVVADATQLRRSLLLCTQMIDLEIPMILVVNMIDLLENSDTRIDFQKLSQLFGIPVLAVSAKVNKGIAELKALLTQKIPLPEKRILKLPEGFLKAIEQIKPQFPTQSEYLAYQAIVAPESFPFFTKEQVQQFQALSGLESGKQLIANEMLIRYERIDAKLEQAMKPAITYAEKWTEKLDKIFLHKVGGYLIFIGVLFLIFQAVFAWASYPQDAIESGFTWLSELLRHQLPNHWLTQLLIDGVLAGMSGVVVFVPQIAFLFFFIAILEETGYMSRVVFLMDRLMRPFGFSGRSIIPLIGGMACAVPSIMTARTIPHPKERLITILVTPLMSCSARIPVYTLLISLLIPNTFFQGLIMLGMYFLGFIMALLAAFIFKKGFRYQSDGIFVSEMPVYRSPSWQNVGITIWQKSKAFVLEAGKMIVLISIILWFLASFAPNQQMQKIEAKFAPQTAQLLTEKATLPDSIFQQKNAVLEYQKNSEKLAASYAGIIGRTIEPVIRPLGFDWKIGIALLTSFAAREVFVGTMSTIYSVGELEEDNLMPLTQKLQAEVNPITHKPQYSTPVALSLLVFYAFAMQCISTLAATKRETQSWKWTIVMLVYMSVLAYLASLFIYQVWG